MSPTRWIGPALAALVILAAGCAGGSRPGPSSTPSVAVSPESVSPSPVRPSTESGSRPPQHPTDTSAAGWFTGMVNRDAQGTCFGLVTDDGVEYAVSSGDQLDLRRNDRVRVRLALESTPSGCGAGQPMRALQVRRVG